jgi:hypothetical protein
VCVEQFLDRSNFTLNLSFSLGPETRFNEGFHFLQVSLITLEYKLHRGVQPPYRYGSKTRRLNLYPRIGYQAFVVVKLRLREHFYYYHLNTDESEIRHQNK